MNDAGKEFVLEHTNIPMDHVWDVVEHYAEGYDPAKAREYYLRTRELKGRTAAAKPAPKGRPAGAKKVAPRPVAQPKTSLQRRKETEARVAAMKLRLEKLRVILKELTSQAKARSGVDPKKDPKQKASDKDKGKKKNLTPQQEKALKKWREDYLKKNHKEPTVTEQEAQLAQQVKDAEAKIAEIRAKLKKSVKKKPAATSRPNT